MKNCIEVRELSKEYQDGAATVRALKNISFRLPSGESLGVFGSSGSGKTTLLQLIGGLESPTSGEVIVDGQALGTLSDNELSAFRNRTIGFVFQFFYLQEYLSALENVMLPALLSGDTSPKTEARARELLAQFGLADKMKQRPNSLSGGEMQRVAIARALINQPKLILADEPTGNLDRENAELILDVFEEVARSGVSVVIITHDESLRERFRNTIHLTKSGQTISIR